MGYWKRGPRLPDEYSEGWEKDESISTEHAFWMMGHESGYNACKWDYAIADVDDADPNAPNELNRLRQENEAFRMLEDARNRVADKDFDPPK